jgi:hypothetical protein
MILLAARFLALVGTGLAAGAALCVVFFERSFSGDGARYADYKQLSIRALTIPVPVLGAIGLLGLAAQVSLTWKQEGSLALGIMIAAFALNLVAALLTRFVHFPINDQIMTWTSTSLPDTWLAVRDRWAFVHAIRTSVTVASFALLSLVSVLRTSTF